MTKDYRYFLLFLILFISKCLVAQQIDGEQDSFFREWQNSHLLKNASIGISVINAETGEKILVSTPQLSLIPASVLKMVTTATALEILGPDFRFETKLAYLGEIDSLSGTLKGDLIIVGGGDPALGSAYFKNDYLEPHFILKWVKTIQQLGIKKITGNIIADASVYEEQMIPNTWIWEDIGNYFGAGACGLSVYDNMYLIRMNSYAAGVKTDVIGTQPEVPGLQLQNEVFASKDKRDLAYVFGSPFESKRIVKGTIPENKNDFKIKASIPNPPYLLANQVKLKLMSNNIVVEGEAVISYIQVPFTKVVDIIQSPMLRDIIEVTNHESVNLFAEHFCKHLAYVQTGKGTTKAGLDVIANFWKEKGIDTQGMFLADGSGLSRFNAITADQLSEMLKYINQSGLAKTFKESLPTVGDGTLVVFSPEKFPNSCLYAKSGSMTRVRCYAGFLKTISGKELIFAVMLNNFSCTQAEAVLKIEELLFQLKNE